MVVKYGRPNEADATNKHPTPVTTVTIPHIKCTSETISRILQPYNIRVAHKPTTKLRHLLTNVKDRDKPNIRKVSFLVTKQFSQQDVHVPAISYFIPGSILEIYDTLKSDFIQNWQLPSA